jgi:pyrimidine deaminase RibD-like protein
VLNGDASVYLATYFRKRIIDQEIMPEVEKILAQSVGGVISREKGRMELLQSRTRQVDSAMSGKLGSLTRHLKKLVNDTQQQICNEVTLQLLEQRKKHTSSQTIESPVADDYKFAKLALEEARKSVAEGDNKPHPKVGAVVVKDGQALSVAHRGEVLGNHAEFMALEKKLADSPVAGATVYTTLEPCTTRNHPKVPCADRLVERRVGRVVVGMLDPDERITGRGIQRLRNADIRIDFFPHALMKEVEELNRDFTRHCKHQTQSLSTGTIPLSNEVVSPAVDPAQLPQHKSRAFNWHKEWKEMEADFKRIENPLVFAECGPDLNGADTWQIRSDLNSVDIEPYKALCELAGSRLIASSPPIPLTETTKSQLENWIRWLCHVRDVQGFTTPMMHSRKAKNGSLNHYEGGLIENLAGRSALVCIKCRATTYPSRQQPS